MAGHEDIADIGLARHNRQMTSRGAIIVFASTLSLTACSAEPTPSVAQARTDEARAGETIETISLAPHQWRKDPDCFEPGAQTLDDTSGFFDVERIKWRNPRTLRGYYYTNFEGGSFVAAQRTELPDGLEEGRYQTDLHSDAPNFPSSVEPQTYWIEFVGKEALCNAQRPDDAKFDVPMSRNLVRVEKIILLARIH